MTYLVILSSQSESLRVYGYQDFRKLRQSRKLSLSHATRFIFPDLRRSSTWHSRPIPIIWSHGRLISLHLSISVDVPLRVASSPFWCPPMVHRIWESTTRFVRYGATALATIRTSRQLVNSNLRSPLIEERTRDWRDCTGGQMKRFPDATGPHVIIVPKL